jgi:hypothetical protein
MLPQKSAIAPAMISLTELFAWASSSIFAIFVMFAFVTLSPFSGALPFDLESTVFCERFFFIPI